MGKGKRLTFTFSILTLFIGLAIFLSLSLIVHNYIQGKQNSYDMLSAKNSEIRKNIIQVITTSLESVSSKLTITANLNENANILPSKDILLKIMWEQLKTEDNIASIYLADTFGDFLQARRIPEFALRTIADTNGTRYEFWEYKNLKGQTLSTKSYDATYDPRSRPWYQHTVQQNSFYWSDPYKFASTGDAGITVAYPVFDAEGKKIKVAAADFTLRSISELLKIQAKALKGDIIIFDAEGRVLASSFETRKTDSKEIQNIKDIGKDYVSGSFEELKNGKKDGLIKAKDGNKFLYKTSVFPERFGKKWYLSTYLNEKQITEKINQILIQTTIISLIIIFFIIVVTWYALHRIVIAPVNKLKVLNRAIAEQHFEKVKPIESKIKEFHELSSSMCSMSQSIQDYQEAQKKLLDSFIKLIAEAIDDKSPYTGGHCERVPELAEMLAKEASDSDVGIFKDFKLATADEWREFNIASWLHDCGKVVTPEYVVDKATKLETINNRIHEVRTRFEILLRDAKIALLEGKIDEAHYVQQCQKIKNDFAFIAECNIGGEFMSEEKTTRLKEIAKITWVRYLDDRLGLSEAENMRLADTPKNEPPHEETLLQNRADHIIKRTNENIKELYEHLGVNSNEIPENAYNNGELYNLLIKKGTLTPEERFKINEHVIMTIRMLQQLPLTDNLRKIPEYAGAHHETMTGSGYPKGLTKEEISIPARIMAIADIFEALTASDRPYKKPKKLSEALKIMEFMSKDGHIDSDLYELFVKSGIYKRYAEKYLDSSQIDML